MAYDPPWDLISEVVENPPPLVEDILTYLQERIATDPTKSVTGGTLGETIDQIISGANTSGGVTAPNGQSIAAINSEGALDDTLPPTSEQSESPYDWPGDFKTQPGSEDPRFNKGQHQFQQWPGNGFFNPSLWGGYEQAPGDSSQVSLSPLLGGLSQLQEGGGSGLGWLASLFNPAIFGEQLADPYGTPPSSQIPNYSVGQGNGGYGLRLSNGTWTGPIWDQPPTDAQLQTQLQEMFPNIPPPGQPPGEGGKGNKGDGGGGGGDPFDPQGSQFWGQGPVKDWDNWWANPDLGLTPEQRKAARFNFFNDRYFDGRWSDLTGNEDAAWWGAFENQVEQQQWENWAGENGIPLEHLSAFYKERHGRPPPWIEGNDATPTSQWQGGTGATGGGTTGGGTGGVTPTVPPAGSWQERRDAMRQAGAAAAAADPRRQAIAEQQARWDARGPVGPASVDLAGVQQAAGPRALGLLTNGQQFLGEGDYRLWDLMQAGPTAGKSEMSPTEFYGQFSNWGGLSPGQDPAMPVLFQGRDGNWYTYSRTVGGHGQNAMLPGGVGYDPNTNGFGTLRNWGSDLGIAGRDVWNVMGVKPTDLGVNTHVGSLYPEGTGPTAGGFDSRLVGRHNRAAEKERLRNERRSGLAPPPGPVGQGGPKGNAAPQLPPPARPQDPSMPPMDKGTGSDFPDRLGTGSGQPNTAVRSVGQTSSNRPGPMGARRAMGNTRRTSGLFTR